MSIRPEHVKPPEEIDEELASAVQELSGYAEYLEFRLPRSLATFVCLPTSDDLIQETFMQARENWKRFSEARDRRSWLCTVMRRVFANMCEQALTRHRLMEGEFGDD